VALVFFGGERWREEAHADKADKDELTEPEPVGDEAHGGHGHGEPHEAPWTMAAPLVVLAVLSAVGGVLNLPVKSPLLEEWLKPVLGEAVGPNTSTKWVLGVVVTALALAGVALGFLLWSRRAERPQLEPVVLRKAWGVDALYAAVFGTGGGLVAAESAAIDKAVIDGAVNGTGNVVRVAGSQLRKLQTGYVRNYALGIAAGVVLLLGYGVVRMGV
jgi:NADH-quinone oxidoreductase subunit L